MAEALTAAAARHGLVVVLDDLQWADAATDTGTVDQGPLRAALSALVRESTVTRIHLDGLVEADVATQLAGVTGWAVPDSVPHATHS